MSIESEISNIRAVLKFASTQGIDSPGIGLSSLRRLEDLIPLERTADGHAQVWLLYRPEPFEVGSDDDRSIHLWVRRCDVFTSRDAAVHFLASLTGEMVAFRPHELFPELWIGETRGQRWLLCPSPVDPPGGVL